MKRIALVLALGASLASVGTAEAAGCLKGAAVGGVAGHFAGHHPILGAIAGCAIGHHHATVQRRQQRQMQNAPDQDGDQEQTKM